MAALIMILKWECIFLTAMFFLVDKNNLWYILCFENSHKSFPLIYLQKYYKIQTQKFILIKCYFPILYIKLPHKSDGKQQSTAKI